MDGWKEVGGQAVNYSLINNLLFFLNTPVFQRSLPSQERVCKLSQDSKHSKTTIVKLPGLEVNPVLSVGISDAVSDTIKVPRAVIVSLGSTGKLPFKEAAEEEDLKPGFAGYLGQGGEWVAAELAVVEGVELFLGEDSEDGEHWGGMCV